ncbi:MAG: phosphatidylglycerophosphatase A family protein [Bacillota bacterium]
MKKIFKYFNKFLVTGFFIGLIPGAPGTYGSLLALLFIYLFSITNNIIFLITFIIIATITSYLDELYTGIEDNPQVVIDEIAGIFITFLAIEYNLLYLVIGFILFRLFDIFKPLLIDEVQKLPYGIGVMADDILAGIMANLILRIIIIIL